jgi:AcrR family transcriptional regulator
MILRQIMVEMSKKREFTKGILLDAFWQLYRNHEIEKITIQRIADKAGYNRITFYDYFRDIYDVLDCFENRILSEIEERIYSSFCAAGSATSDAFKEHVVSIFNEYREFLDKLFGDKRNKSFEVKMQKFIKNLLINYSESAKDFNNKYILEFYTSGLVGAFRMWFRSGCDVPIKTFLSIIHAIL